MALTAIPDDLADAILARLDAVGTERAIAELCAEHPEHAPAIRNWLGRAGAVSTAAERLTQATADSDPVRVGAYRILRCLGRGGMGVVYLGRHTALERLSAIKLIRHEWSDAPQARARFEREARALAKLDHPALCPVFESGVHGGLPFMAMKFIAGQTLAERIEHSRRQAGGMVVALTDIGEDSSAERGPRRFAQIATFFEDVARALDCAHRAGLVHRDIKPANIMVQPDGRPVVMDFGLVRADDPAEPGLSHSGQLLGTPLYMAPEQIDAEREVDARVDVYAAGASLFECLALAPPFEASARTELFRRIRLDPPPDLRRLVPGLPRDLATITEKALAKDPDERYRTAAALADDLARFVRLEPIHARRTSWFGRTSRWCRRYPLVAGLLAALVVGLCGAIYFAERASRHLADFTRIADVRRLADLRVRAEQLWPARPDGIAEFEAWLRDVEPLRARLELHEATLRDVERRGVRIDAPDADTQRRLEDYRELLARVATRDLDPATLPLGPDGRTVAKTLADLEAEARDQHHFELAADDAWLHGILTILVAELRTFLEGPRGEVASVQERLAWARTVHATSIDAHRTAWEAAIVAIADPRQHPEYGGLRLSPQPGLVPLGRDPQSGLQEFAHLRSGSPAVRAADGKLTLHDDTGIVLVLLPGGSFVIGEGGQQKDESPAHVVELEPFLIAKFEVTQAQWLRTKGANPSFLDARSPYVGAEWRRHPVEAVSWRQAEAMARALDLELPTEAQWEYAARAGTSTAWWTGDDRVSLHGRVNLADRTARDGGGAPDWPYEMDAPGLVPLADGFVGHAPVGTFAANKFGLHEVAGNVGEWCRDWFEHYEFPARSGDGLRVGLTRELRNYRGGSFRANVAELRSANRQAAPPDLFEPDLGVRLARRLDPAR